MYKSTTNVGIQYLPDPRGLYALTKDGQIGVYDDQKKFRVDDELTSLLQTHAQRLLEMYLRGENTESIRVGFVYTTHKQQAWGHISLFVEDQTLRRLYPTNVVDGPLTEFQKKNQEKSIYRGLELLLDYRTKDSQTRFYCPVLFDRGLMLNHYLSRLGRVEEDRDSSVPVFEVINLIAGLSVSERATETIDLLGEKIYGSVVQKEKRRDLGLTVGDAGERSTPNAGADEVYRERDVPEVTLDQLRTKRGPGGAPAVQQKATTPDAKVAVPNTSIPVQVPKAGGANITLPGQVPKVVKADPTAPKQEVKPPRAMNLSAATLDELFARQGFKHIEAFKESPPRTVASEDLRKFTHFQAGDRGSLELLASKALIYSAPKRATLLERGMTDHWNLYLLEGSLTLTAEDGQTLTIEGGSPKAANPIASLKPRKYTVTSATKVKFLWIPDVVAMAMAK